MPPRVLWETLSWEALNSWLGEQLKQLVPVSSLIMVDLQVEGRCVQFSPWVKAAELET